MVGCYQFGEVPEDSDHRAHSKMVFLMYGKEGHYGIQRGAPPPPLAMTLLLTAIVEVLASRRRFWNRRNL